MDFASKSSISLAMATAGDTSRHAEPGRSKAKLALNEVLARYGIQDPNKEGPPQGKSLTLITRRPKGGPRGPVKTSSGSAEKVIPQNKPALVTPPDLDTGWRNSQGKADGAKRTGGDSNLIPANFASTSHPDTDDSVFHFLVRIAECNAQLHCQVTSESAVAARQQVAGLPNLIECREISAAKLAELMRMETPRQKKGGKGAE
jgi:hypothetical protein